MRTREQIIADLEARYAELEAEAPHRRRAEEVAAVQRARPCKKCEYGAGLGSVLCKEPLVVGFNPDGFVLSYDAESWRTSNNLCGPEKALWQPKLPLWQRIINFLTGVEGDG